MTSSSEVTMSGRVRAAGVGHTEPHSHRTTSRDKRAQEERDTEGQVKGRQARLRCVCLVVNRQLMVSSGVSAAQVKPLKKTAVACELEIEKRRIMMQAGPG